MTGRISRRFGWGIPLGGRARLLKLVSEERLMLGDVRIRDVLGWLQASD